MLSTLLGRRGRAPERAPAGRTRRRLTSTRRSVRKLWLELLEDRTLPAAWVMTDKSDYAPGEVVRITGGEFAALEAVNLQVLHADGRPNTGPAYEPWQVIADVTGGFFTTWVVPDDARGATLLLTAAGQTSGSQAQTTFTDAALASIEAWKTTPPAGWQSSTLNPGSHSYSEGDSIPFRYVFPGLTPGSVWSVTVQYDFANGPRHFFDSLSTYNQSTAANPTAGHTVSSGPNTFPIPTDPLLPPGAQIPGSFTVYNGTITSAGPVYTTATVGGNTVKQLTLTGTVALGGAGTTRDVLVLFGGHLARENEWGPQNGASSFPGASAKMFFVNFVGSTGNDTGDNLSINPGGIVKKADLGITKADSSDPVVVGNNLTYTLTVSNSGPNQATAGTVTDTLPAGTTFISATSASFTFTSSGSTVTGTLNSGTPINAGSWATIQIVVRVEPTAGDPITNTATITSSTPTDPNTANNTATSTTAVLPAFSINDVSRLEGDSGTTSFTFIVTRSGPTNRTATVNYTTADGTALVADGDYQATSGTLTFGPGQTSHPVTVLVNGDIKFEPDEAFSVILSAPTNAGIADGQGHGTIRNDDGQPAIRINDVTQAEGNGGTTAFTFTVSLSNPSHQTVTVTYSTADGTAMAPGDYCSTSGALTFAAGTTSQTVTVPVNGDTTSEPDETFFVNLSNPSNATIADGQGVGTIVNDDGQPSISINDVSQAEGNSGTTAFTFTISLSNPSSQPVMVDFATADGTATAPGDYTAADGTIAFGPGLTTATVTVLVNGDMTSEQDETFFVNLSNPSNATIADSQGRGTIVNDDTRPSLSINDVSQAEGNSGTTAFTFTISLSNASSDTVTVNYSTADGTATAPEDYVPASGTVTFAPGTTSQTVTVLVNGDTTFEPDESFVVNLSVPGIATIADGQGQGTILNDDGRPTISINDVAQAEGNSGTSSFTFTLTLSNSSFETVTVHYSTTDGTATTADNDYLAASGTVTFAPGQTSQSAMVQVVGDNKFEPDETFTVDLDLPINATVSDGQGAGTIRNDDAQPTVSVGDSSHAEGNAGPTLFVFNVTLSNPSDQPITVNFATADGSATLADGDYVTAAGMVTFAPGTISQMVMVPVNGDNKFESDETFSVNLSMPTNATLADGQGVGTIQNDDAPPTITITDVSADEGNAGTKPFTFTVTLSNASSETVTVHYSTADDTATTTDNDYQSASGTVTFASGEIVQTITVQVVGDIKFEPTETFFVHLSAPNNASIADGEGLGTIVNDDAQPTITINNVAANEGNSGSTTFTFIVSLSNPSSETITVDFATADGTATTADTDYVAASGSVTFAAGATSQTVTVSVVGDTKFEPAEAFLVNLSNPGNATILVGTGTGTIVNDDTQPTISINDVEQAEGDSGSGTFTFTVTLSNASSETVTVSYATSDSTAMVADNDYVFASGSVTFAPGQTSQTVTVTVNGDNKFEPDETFFVDLFGAANATVADPQGQGTIQNDDTQPTISINDITLAEGNAGLTTFTFTVTLSNASYQTITVNYATADGTALVTDGDYAADAGVLTFAPGTTSQTVTVLVNGDSKFEPDETFLVNLSMPINATVADSQGLGTILNDDAPPTVSIGDAAENEGHAGTTPFAFTVTLSNPSFQTVSVIYSTANGTATTADNDYQTASGTVTFAPGQVMQTVTIDVNGDNKFEPNETFFVNLSAPTHATVADGQGLGTIVNDDAQPTITINNMAANEGNSGTTPFTFTVTLSNPSYQTVTVQYTTADGTATTADNDYVAASGTVTFAPGTTTQPVTVNVVGDTKFELDETFLVTLSNADNATILVGTGTATILNDDNQPTISISDRTANEGDAGTTPFVFKVTLSNPTFQTVTVNYFTANSTATTGDGDYVAANGTVTFLPGQMTQSVTVSVNGDIKFEQDETFYVNLSGPTNATVADGQGLGTIVNDDAQPTILINDVVRAEGNSGTTGFTFTVSLTNPSYQTVTVSYATVDGTATTADNDYLAASSTVTFAPGTTSQTITIDVVGDKKVEPDEAFFVNLTAATNATLPPGSKGTGTILNDDHAPVAVPDNYSTNEDTTLSVPPPGVLGNDTDADGDALTAVQVTGPMHGTLTLNPNGSFSYTPAANYNGPDEFVYQASDGTNSSEPATVTITVAPVNDPPVVSTITITPEPSQEGQLVTLVATFTDPDLADTHTATINWGNGTATSAIVSPNGNGTFTVTGNYAYPDDGPSPGNGTSQDTYTVTVTITDAAGATGSKSKSHVVQNVAPIIQAVTCPVQPSPATIPITVGGAFTDVGVGDVHTAVWNWGDGTTSAGTVVEAGGSGTVTGTHTYAAEGVYTLTLTVYDDDGGSDTHTCPTFVVVFGLDTKVTGGGWINSPPGAAPARPTATGKANFGFNAKYHVGNTTPSGETNFRFGPGNLHFHSTSYDPVSLIVTTVSPGVQRAEWRGSGWINGSGDFAFKVMVIDAGEPGSSDKFRIRIWNKITQAVIYDNEMGAPDAASPMTVIGGGNIQVHSFLHAAVSVDAVSAGGATLTEEALAPFVEEAAARWHAAATDGDFLSALAAYAVRVADLPDTILGVTTPGVIWIDRDAAGHGWFIDDTPADDQEFAFPGEPTTAGRVDLLTVVAHEMGHALGLEHSDDGVMHESLGVGIRHSPGCGCLVCADAAIAVTAAPAEMTPTLSTGVLPSHSSFARHARRPVVEVTPRRAVTLGDGFLFEGVGRVLWWGGGARDQSTVRFGSERTSQEHAAPFPIRDGEGQLGAAPVVEQRRRTVAKDQAASEQPGAVAIGRSFSDSIDEVRLGDAQSR